VEVAASTADVEEAEEAGADPYAVPERPPVQWPPTPAKAAPDPSEPAPAALPPVALPPVALPGLQPVPTTQAMPTTAAAAPSTTAASTTAASIWPWAAVPVTSPATPAVTPAATPAPTMTTPEREVVTTSLTVENINYNQLVADPALSQSLATAVTNEVARVAKVNPSRVSTTLSAGSVVAQSSIFFPRGIDTDDFVRVKNDMKMGIESLGENVADAVSSLAGIDSVATGAISVSAGTVNSAAGEVELTAREHHELPLPDEETCTPACIEGQGICDDGLCFCRTPFTGLQCEKQMKQGLALRMSMGLATGLVCCACIIGVGVGVVLFMAFSQFGKPSQGFTEALRQHETWKVAGAGGK